MKKYFLNHFNMAIYHFALLSLFKLIGDNMKDDIEIIKNLLDENDKYLKNMGGNINFTSLGIDTLSQFSALVQIPGKDYDTFLYFIKQCSHPLRKLLQTYRTIHQPTDLQTDMRGNREDTLSKRLEYSITSGLLELRPLHLMLCFIQVAQGEVLLSLMFHLATLAMVEEPSPSLVKVSLKMSSTSLTPY